MDRNEAMSALLAAAILSGAKKTKTEDNKDNKDNGGIKEVARLLYDAYIAFIEVGFTEEQAFQLTLALKD